MWEIGYCLNPRYWSISWGGEAWDDDGNIVGRVWSFGPVAVFRLYQ